jgi:hypothetical protein
MRHRNTAIWDRVTDEAGKYWGAVEISRNFSIDVARINSVDRVGAMSGNCGVDDPDPGVSTWGAAGHGGDGDDEPLAFVATTDTR